MIMYRWTVIFILILVFSTTIFAQQATKITPQGPYIDSTGKQLQQIAERIQTDTILYNRFQADSLFTRMLVQTLQQVNSISFKLDSLHSISHITSPDNFFKLYSWQIDLGDGTFRQRGAIQLYTKDGHLKLIPLFDNSDFLLNPAKGIFNRKQWMGAIYYDIIPIKVKGQSFYTLLGYDEYTNNISRKIIEVLHFEQEEPVFGGDFFKYPSDPTYPTAPVDRFVLQYKKGSSAIIKYEATSNRIVISELASTDHDLTKIETLVPSGNEKYFYWLGNQWTLKK
jgi:hypothetical protein